MMWRSGNSIHSIPTAIGAAVGHSGSGAVGSDGLGSVDAGTYPVPAQQLPRPPNNHLSYAITWYGLAVALVVIFGVWIRKALRS